MSHSRRVGLFIHAWHSYSRAVLRGASAEGQKLDWELIAPWPGIERWPTPTSLNLDGVIYSSGVSSGPPPPRRGSVPVVTVGDAARATGRVDVGWDNDAIGELACKHLAQLGHRNLSAWHTASQPYQCERAQGFAHAARIAKLNCTIVDTHQTGRAELLRLLRKPSAPTALFCASDQLGYDTLRLAEAAGRRVPADLAVVGAGNDEDFCELTSPPLSSVALPGETAGRLAIRKLQRLFKGRPPTSRPTLTPPRAVVPRQSSDALVVEDLEVARALRLIRDLATDGLTPAGVHHHSPLARRTLEMRFRAATGHTIQTEIARIRHHRARELLIETDLPVADVAARCGFASPSQFAATFHQHEGMSPTTCRLGYQATS
ncbi:MAG: substrate-binding domain-containing protein [Planctomycetota bacterium]